MGNTITLHIKEYKNKLTQLLMGEENKNMWYLSHNKPFYS